MQHLCTAETKQIFEKYFLLSVKKGRHVLVHLSITMSLFICQSFANVFKKGVLENFTNFTGKHCCFGVSF